MTRIALFTFAIGAVGCSQQPAQEARADANVAVTPAAPQNPPAAAVVAPPQPAQPVAAEQPKPPEPPREFEYPADLGGKAVAGAVTPKAPPPPPSEARAGAGPKPRRVPARVIDPDPIAKAVTALPPILPTQSGAVRPTDPAERVPVDLGVLANAVPARTTFPVTAGVTERARDVNLPPAMPVLGRPLNDRVSLDDPTAELAHAAVTAPVVKAQLNPAGFLKVSLPDPFELGEQVRPRVPPSAEPGLTPVAVNPQRPH